MGYRIGLKEKKKKPVRTGVKVDDSFTCGAWCKENYLIRFFYYWQYYKIKRSGSIYYEIRSGKVSPLLLKEVITKGKVIYDRETQDS